MPVGGHYFVFTWHARPFEFVVVHVILPAPIQPTNRFRRRLIDMSVGWQVRLLTSSHYFNENSQKQAEVKYMRTHLMNDQRL